MKLEVRTSRSPRAGENEFGREKRGIDALIIKKFRLARASPIAEIDTKANTRSVALAKLEDVRTANVPGTRAYVEAQKHRARLNA